jgi:16S rRNA U516 pseudouridylate synthase RsuA-like enzyme
VRSSLIIYVIDCEQVTVFIIFVPSLIHTTGVETQLGKFPANLLEAQCDLSSKTSLVRLVVTEGKHRMVRRILHNSGHSVLSLRRIRYGKIFLGDLPEGACRAISDEEFQWLVALFHK